MNKRDFVNIGICGQVSTGKSTCINALMGKYLSQTKLRRTTKAPLTFIHGNHRMDDLNSIQKTIQIINEVDKADRNSVEYNVNFPFIKNPNSKCKLIDFPGFNDGKEDIQGMEKLFYNKIKELDFIIYIMNAESALMLKSEITLLEGILSKVQENHKNNNYTRIIFVFNKLDDEDNEEIKEVISDAKNTLEEILKKMSFASDKFWFYSVSFRKMMIKSMYDNGGNTEDIPNGDLQKTLSEIYGKTQAKKIIANKDHFEITLTNDENSLFNLLERISDNMYNKIYISEKFIAKLSKINNINQSLVTCIDNHKYLKDIEHTCYSQIIRTHLQILENKIYRPEKTYQKIISYFDTLEEIFKHYVSSGKTKKERQSQTNAYISSLYFNYLNMDEKLIKNQVYSYIVTRFIDKDINDWLTDTIINNLHQYNCGYFKARFISKPNLNYTKIVNGKIVNKDPINLYDIYNVKVMEKISRFNSNEIIYHFIEKMDFMLCQPLYYRNNSLSDMDTYSELPTSLGFSFNSKGQITQLDSNCKTISNLLKKLTFEKSKECMIERCYSTCARMEFNYIKKAGINSGYKYSVYPGIVEYHKWSSKYTGIWTKQPISSSIVSLLPSHVMNHIMLSRVTFN